MQVSLSAAWNSAGIMFVPFQILLGKDLKLTQFPKCCNLAKQFSFTHEQSKSCAFVSCHRDFRSSGSVCSSSENTAHCYFHFSSSFMSSQSLLQIITNCVNLKFNPFQVTGEKQNTDASRIKWINRLYYFFYHKYSFSCKTLCILKHTTEQHIYKCFSPHLRLK